MIIPISEASVQYAQKVRLQLRAAKLHVEVDDSDRKMQKKVREAQLAQFNYILVSLPPPLFLEFFPGHFHSPVMEHVLPGVVAAEVPGQHQRALCIGIGAMTGQIAQHHYIIYCSASGRDMTA
jgi:hypothetical protein